MWLGNYVKKALKSRQRLINCMEKRQDSDHKHATTPGGPLLIMVWVGSLQCYVSSSEVAHSGAGKM